MNNKRFNKNIVVTVFFFVIFIAFFNYAIDPFDVFHTQNRFNNNRPNIDKNHRISKIPAFKLNREKVDAIWVGSSKTGWSSNEEYESSVLKANIKNLSINACSFYEAITMVKNAKLIHPEIKTVYFGIDFCMMNDVIEKADILRPTQKAKLTKEEVLPLLISIDSTQNSLKTLLTNFKKKEIASGIYGQEKQYNKKVIHKFKNTINSYHKGYENFKLSEKKIDDLKEFINWSNENGVKVIFFTTTMHIAEQILIDNTGNTDAFYKFKEELAQIQPYYDFAVVDKYTTDEIKPEMQYFRDAVHAYPFIRKKISDRLFGINEDFGYFVDKNNIKSHNANNKALFIKYRKEHPELVEDVKQWCD